MFIQLAQPTKAVANNLRSSSSEKIHHQPVKFKVAVQQITTITEDHGLHHQISNSNNSVLLQ
jgi:hypothetical protein